MLDDNSDLLLALIEAIDAGVDGLFSAYIWRPGQSELPLPKTETDRLIFYAEHADGEVFSSSRYYTASRDWFSFDRGQTEELYRAIERSNNRRGAEEKRALIDRIRSFRDSKLNPLP